MDNTRQENFENMQLTVIEQDNQEWFTAEEIGKALGFTDPKRSVMQILNRNRSLFSGFYKKLHGDSLCEIISKKYRKSTCFNSQGAILVALIAKTPKSKALGIWFAKFMAHAERRTNLNGAFCQLENSIEKGTKQIATEIARIRSNAENDFNFVFKALEDENKENAELKRKLAIAERRLQSLTTIY